MPRSSSPPCMAAFCSTCKYQERFSPTDFDLVISDEAHRVHRRQRAGGLRVLRRLQTGADVHAPRLDRSSGEDTSGSGVLDPRETERRKADGHLPHIRLRKRSADLPVLTARRGDGRRAHQSASVVQARSDVTTQLHQGRRMRSNLYATPMLKITKSRVQTAGFRAEVLLTKHELPVLQDLSGSRPASTR